MKTHKILMAALILSGSLLTFSSIQAAPNDIISAVRVRTVPGNTNEQKKKETNTVTQPAKVTPTPAKTCSQSKYLLSSNFIGNGGMPK